MPSGHAAASEHAGLSGGPVQCSNSKLLRWHVLRRLEQVHGLSSMRGRLVGKPHANSGAQAACGHQFNIQAIQETRKTTHHGNPALSTMAASPRRVNPPKRYLARQKLC